MKTRVAEIEVSYKPEKIVEFSISDSRKSFELMLLDWEHKRIETVSYTHLRAHETDSYLVCRLLLEKKKYAVFCLKKKNSFFFFFFLMIRRQPRSTHCISSAASDVYKRQVENSWNKYVKWHGNTKIFLSTFKLKQRWKKGDEAGERSGRSGSKSWANHAWRARKWGQRGEKWKEWTF